MEKEAVELAKEFGCESEFTDIEMRSKNLALSKDNYYRHHPLQCLAAAAIASKKRKVVYLQVNTGQGKTKINLLALDYLQRKKKDAKFLYLTIRDFLVADVKR